MQQTNHQAIAHSDSL